MSRSTTQCRPEPACAAGVTATPLCAAPVQAAKTSEPVPAFANAPPVKTVLARDHRPRVVGANRTVRQAVLNQVERTPAEPDLQAAAVSRPAPNNRALFVYAAGFLPRSPGRRQSSKCLQVARQDQTVVRSASMRNAGDRLRGCETKMAETLTASHCGNSAIGLQRAKSRTLHWSLRSITFAYVQPRLSARGRFRIGDAGENKQCRSRAWSAVRPAQ